jgi:uncharacterized Zn finger protein
VTARESVVAKAARYLLEGRLTVLRRDGDLVEAVCHGTHGVYELGHDPDRPGVWHCSCPSAGRCSHVTALMLVVVPRRAA